MLPHAKMIIFIGVTIFIISCDSPSESVTTKIKIGEVWLDDFIDTDNDGYNSDANLYFNLTTNTNNFNVFINLGIRKSSDNPDDLYDLCFESEDLTLIKDSDNIWYIPVHNLNYQLEQDNYDFLLRVYKSDNPESIADELSPSEDTDLYNIALESDTTDLYKEWITYIDDDMFETSFTYYPRMPLGAYYVDFAEKFEKPAQSGFLKLLAARVHIPYIYSSPVNIGLSIMDDIDNEPNETQNSNSISNATTGWNHLKWEYDLTDHEVFYISIAPSLNYAVSQDTNSVTENSYGLWYSTGNPPSLFWRERNNNIGIEIFVGYSVPNGLSKINPLAKMCRRRF